MKKFGVTKTVKICSVGLLLCGVALFIIGIVCVLHTGALTHLLKYGSERMMSDDRKALVMFVIGVAGFFVFIQEAKVMYGRFICVGDEKVNGNIGVGFIGKTVEFNYQEIISSCCKKDVVVIETAKGTFYFPKIESAAECSDLINKKINCIKEKDA